MWPKRWTKSTSCSKSCAHQVLPYLHSCSTYLSSHSATVTFCHNDVQPMNCIYNEEENSVNFIEYVTPAHLSLCHCYQDAPHNGMSANPLNAWRLAVLSSRVTIIGAGTWATTSVNIPALTSIGPSSHPRRNNNSSSPSTFALACCQCWCTATPLTLHPVCLYRYLSNFLEREPTEGEVRKALVESNKFTLVSHLYWGIWGLVQTKVSDIDYDFFHYALRRLRMYQRTKPHLIEAPVPQN